MHTLDKAIPLDNGKIVSKSIIESYDKILHIYNKTHLIDHSKACQNGFSLKLFSKQIYYYEQDDKNIPQNILRLKNAANLIYNKEGPEVALGILPYYLNFIKADTNIWFYLMDLYKNTLVNLISQNIIEDNPIEWTGFTKGLQDGLDITRYKLTDGIAEILEIGLVCCFQQRGFYTKNKGEETNVG